MEGDLSQVLAQLREPFSPECVEWKISALTEDKSRALAAAYVDARRYQERLDAVCPDWEDHIEFLKPDGSLVKVSLTVAGVTREEVGEADPEEDNTATSAVAQAFKRACAAFGLGRYLYFLPQQWVPYDPSKRRLLAAPQLPRWALPHAPAGQAVRQETKQPAPAQVASWPQEEPEQPATAQQAPHEPAPAAGAPNWPEEGPEEPPDPDEEAEFDEDPEEDLGDEDPDADAEALAQFVVEFGKNRGRTLGDLAKHQPDYIRWLAAVDDARPGTRLADAVAAARLFLEAQGQH